MLSSGHWKALTSEYYYSHDSHYNKSQLFQTGEYRILLVTKWRDHVYTCVSEIQQIYRTNVVSYICVVLNNCLSVGVGLVVWFLYQPPPPAASTIIYGVVGGLQLWISFFGNIVLLVGKASTMYYEYLYSFTKYGLIKINPITCLYLIFS